MAYQPDRTQPVRTQADRTRRAARLAVIGGLSSFGPLSLDLYLPALPQVATTLHTSDGAAQLSVSCCLAGLAIGQFVFGPLGDRFGRRRPLLAGVGLWTVAAVLCAVAPSVTALVILRLIQGFGGAAGLVGLFACLVHPLGLLLVVLGTPAWAVGHWHYALRHHAYKSPLARRVYLQVLPARLDPTRYWAAPTTRRHG